MDGDILISDCPNCEGSGLDNAAEGGNCANCNGTGQIED